MAQFNVTWKQFGGKKNGKTGEVKNVGLDYFTTENGFNDFDRERITNMANSANAQCSYTRGSGVRGGYSMVQPNNTFMVERVA